MKVNRKSFPLRCSLMDSIIVIASKALICDFASVVEEIYNKGDNNLYFPVDRTSSNSCQQNDFCIHMEIKTVYRCMTSACY